MHLFAPVLSAFSGRHDRLGHAPRVATGAAIAHGDPSPIVARAPQTSSNVNPGHALGGRFAVVAIGWALLGIYCAEVFSAFCSH
jgi:hypothetical protein